MKFLKVCCTAGIGDAYFNMTLAQMAATRRHFCAAKPNYRTHFFVFTDHNASTGAMPGSDVTFVHKQRLGWPRDSDDRYSWLLEVPSTLCAVLCVPEPSPSGPLRQIQRLWRSVARMPFCLARSPCSQDAGNRAAISCLGSQGEHLIATCDWVKVSQMGPMTGDHEST